MQLFGTFEGSVYVGILVHQPISFWSFRHIHKHTETNRIQSGLNLPISITLIRATITVFVSDFIQLIPK